MSKMEIEKLLNETNLKWQDMEEKEVSEMAQGIFQAYKESLVFGKYKGKDLGFNKWDSSPSKQSRVGIQSSNLNLFKSKLNSQLSQYKSKHRTGGDMKGMAQKISNQLSKLRSKHMFKMSRMQGQSKINFKKKKTNLSSEVNFSKYKKQDNSLGTGLEKKALLECTKIMRQINLIGFTPWDLSTI